MAFLGRYNIGETVTITYGAKRAKTGLTDVVVDVWNQSSAQIVFDGAMVEVSNKGVYVYRFKPITQGTFTVVSDSPSWKNTELSTFIIGPSTRGYGGTSTSDMKRFIDTGLRNMIKDLGKKLDTNIKEFKDYQTKQEQSDKQYKKILIQMEQDKNKIHQELVVPTKTNLDNINSIMVDFTIKLDKLDTGIKDTKTKLSEFEDNEIKSYDSITQSMVKSNLKITNEFNQVVSKMAKTFDENNTIKIKQIVDESENAITTATSKMSADSISKFNQIETRIVDNVNEFKQFKDEIKEELISLASSGDKRGNELVNIKQQLDNKLQSLHQELAGPTRKGLDKLNLVMVDSTVKLDKLGTSIKDTNIRLSKFEDNEIKYQENYKLQVKDNIYQHDLMDQGLNKLKEDVTNLFTGVHSASNVIKKSKEDLLKHIKQVSTKRDNVHSTEMIKNELKRMDTKHNTNFDTVKKHTSDSINNIKKKLDSQMDESRLNMQKEMLDSGE